MKFPSAPAERVSELAARLDRPRSIAIVTHFNPDGDAMGASLGLAMVLKQADHRVTVVLPNTPPENLHWMPGYAEALAFDRDKTASEAAILRSEVLFCLDFNRPDRVGGLEAVVRAAAFKVLVDHHREPDGFADLSFSNTGASSTSEMVHDLSGALGLGGSIGVDAATCLFTGIMTDTGSFRFPSTTPHTLRVAADLVERGAMPERIHEAIMDDNSESRLRLTGFALNERLSVYPELRTAMIVLSRSDLDRYGYRPGDTEGLVNMGLSIRGIRLAAFISERPDVVRLSLRSKGALPVNEFLARHFNGGGHANAAGGQSKEPIAQVVERFLRELPAFLAAHPA